MKLCIALFGIALTASSLSAADFVMRLPTGAKATYSKIETTIPAIVPVGPFINGSFPTEITPKKIRRSVWSMGKEQTITKIGEDISVQLERSGYKEILSCVSKECGGYDFRFAIDVVDEPMMRVNLRDFRFITAKQTVNINPAYVTFLLSNSPVSAYVQVTEYHPTDVSLKVIGEASTVLEGLTFEAGSTSLGTDPKGALAALAKKLKTEKNLRVFLVGHSDMSGSLEGNTKISQRRAESVRSALIHDHGIAPGRLEAHGVGFLSPRATNETEVGAQKNRRVEVVFSR